MNQTGALSTLSRNGRESRLTGRDRTFGSLEEMLGYEGMSGSGRGAGWTRGATALMCERRVMIG